MAGTAISPTPAAGLDAAADCEVSPSLVNSLRISAVAERLALPNNDTSQFFNLCLSLSRGIDYAIANDEVPIKIQSLPVLLKQACQHRNNSLQQAGIMVLMISVKNACKIGWFPAQDSKELLALANEIGSSFCSAGDLNTEVSSSHRTITTIMERFYPRMKMGQMLAFLEVKPGYGTFMIDFHISKSTKPSANNKIWLFVAQIDNLETSSCIISPPQVNFLINGKGVERRTNVFMDTGPQLPTVVMHMLKYGSNLLQAVGEFNGNYIIIVAYMSVVSNPDNHDLKDYFLPTVAAPDSDSELIEGPSRISLICPISLRRIKTPVKGHSCKHHQCFDFDNFVDINSRRPSWRCPHCNQCVCYIDIRIDQNMVKVLKEVGENVTDVIISADGSWKAAAESNDNTDHPNDSASQQDVPVQQKATSFSNAPPDIMDLTEGVDDMDVAHICETQERKPVLADLQTQSGVTKGTIPPDMNNANDVDTAHVEDDFWSGIYFSYGLGASSVRSDAQIVGGASAPAPANFILPPVLTDAVSPAFNREPEAFGGTALDAISTSQSQISVPSNVQLQKSQFGNSIGSNEYGSAPSIPRHINRASIAIQDLPAQTLAIVPQQSPRNSFNTLTQGHSLASQTSILPPIADSFNATSITIERQQQFSRSHLNPHQASQINSSSFQQHSTTQNWDHQNHSFLPSHVAQQIVVLQAPSQLSGAYRISSAPPSENQNSYKQQHSNLRVASSPSRASAGQLPSHFPWTQIPLGGTKSGVGQPPVTRTSQMGSAHRAAQMARQLPSVPVAARQPPSVPVSIQRVSVGDQRGNMGGTLQPSTRTEGLADLRAEHNWRPTGRMRGSLSGPAYSAALNQYIIQQNQAARPPLNNVNSPLPSMSPALHVLLANSGNILASQVSDYPPTEPPSTAGGSGFT